MDLFTAKKLTALRKYYSLSQEALAEKAGVSRQAVSKWERCEASPDTDNLLTLSKIYNVSVDDLLGDKNADEIIAMLQQPQAEEKATESAGSLDTYSVATKVVIEKTASEQPDEGVATAIDGASEIVTEKEKTTVNVTEEKSENKKSDKKSSRRKKEKAPPLYPGLAKNLLKFPYFLVAVIIFLVLGFYGKLWHPGWMIFLTLPAYYLTAFAFFASSLKKLLMRLPVYYYAIMLYILLGISLSLWAHAWILFLLVPIYYWLVSLIKSKK